MTHISDAVVQHFLRDILVDVVHVVYIARSLPIYLEHGPQSLILSFPLVLLTHLFHIAGREEHESRMSK